MGIFLFYYILICCYFVTIYRKFLIFVIGRNRIYNSIYFHDFSIYSDILLE